MKPPPPADADHPSAVTAASALVSDLIRIGQEHGLDAVGVAGAEPFAATRVVLEARQAAGLAAGMQFTYRNPARSTDPGRTLPGAASLVVGVRSYLRQAPPSHPLGSLGRVARYSWVDHYRPLRTALGAIAMRLADAGWRARVLVDDNALVDREAARRAGLGWYGKNTNLLLPGAGSWFVIGSVVTDAPLPAGRPVADGCGTCERCIPACPTGALVAPGVLDARRCLAWLVQAPGVFPAQHRAALGDRLYGCDDCQEACPVNRAAARRHPPPPAEAHAEALVDVLDILRATDEQLLATWGRWYIAERQPRYLRRNALLVLGNVADGQDPSVVEVLSRALVADDSLVRAHAVWAAARLGRPDLLEAVAGDRDPDVQAELVSALGARR